MGQRQTVNLLNRNIKNKTKPINRITTGPYVNFNQLGKSTANYTTENLIGWKKGRPIFETQNFTAKNATKALELLNKTTPSKIGEKIAQIFNPDKQYKSLLEQHEKDVGHKVYTKHPLVGDKNIKVTRNFVQTGSKTAAELVATGNTEWIEKAAGGFGKYSKEVRTEWKNKIDATKSEKDKAALKERYEKVKKERGEKVSGFLKGVANVFGAFNDAFQRNSRG